MSKEEFHQQLDRLDLSLNGLARLLNIESRNVRRWASGALDVPDYVADALRAETPEDIRAQLRSR